MKVLFNFYCKQLHSLGGHTTFDRISHECGTLNLGKFMVFCNATEVYNKHSIMDKKTVMNTFKKTAQGVKEIDFDIFYGIMNKLTEQDPAVADRLGLNDPNVYKEKKRHLSKPFNTKDEGIRETKVYDKVRVIPRQNIYTSKRVKESLMLSLIHI